MWNNFFLNSAVYYLCFRFLLFLTFSFQFRLYVFVKKFLKFLCSFILWIRDFVKDFWKIVEHFSKIYRHSKSKIIHKFHYLLFVFFYYHFWRLFFPISPNQTCQKNSKYFCGALLYEFQIPRSIDSMKIFILTFQNW